MKNLEKIKKNKNKNQGLERDSHWVWAFCSRTLIFDFFDFFEPFSLSEILTWAFSPRTLIVLLFFVFFGFFAHVHPVQLKGRCKMKLGSQEPETLQILGCVTRDKTQKMVDLWGGGLPYMYIYIWYSVASPPPHQWSWVRQVPPPPPWLWSCGCVVVV